MNGPTFAPVPTTAAAPAVRAARPPARSAPAVKPADDAAAVLRVLTYLRLHWLTILFTGALIGSGLAYAAWNLIPSKFESYALLQVASAPSYIANQNDPTRGRTDFSIYLKTTAALIKYQFVLNSALNDPKYKITELPTLAGQKDPLKFLDEKIQIGYSDGSEILRVSMEGDRPEDIQKIVDAVKDAYLREVIEKERQKKQYFLGRVDEARTKLEELMKAKERGLNLTHAAPGTPVAPGVIPAAAQVPVGADNAGIAVPSIPGVAAAPLDIEPKKDPKAPAPLPLPMSVLRAQATLAMNKMFSLQNALEQYPVLMAEKQTEIEAVRQQLKALSTGRPSVEVMEAVDHDPDVHLADAKAHKFRDTANYYAKLGLDPSSPRVAKAKADAAVAEAEATKLREEKAHALEQTRRQGDANKLAPLLDKLERDLKNLQGREQMARKQLEDARKEVAATPPDPTKDGPAALAKKPLVDVESTDLITHDHVYERLTEQQISLKFELDSPDRVEKRQDASNPIQRDTKKQVIGTVFAGLLGFALVGLGIVGYETAARKVSSLGDLKGGGPGPVIGVVPWAPDRAALKDPAKRADVVEAVDKLRSYVSQAWLSRGATTVTVTSPVGDEGKAFTAFGLANSLAQAGYKTLLVDFDLRTPVLHTMAGVENTAGVCGLLRGDTDARDAVVGLPNGLWFVPAGAWSEAARQAAVGGKLDAVLRKLKEPFDCVILHGTALLTVAEAVEIARRSEVVLLCSQYRETKLPLLKRAADRVATMEIPHSGIVYLGATPKEAMC